MRHKDDFYRTPPWCVETLLKYWTPPEEDELIIEPSAGDGAIANILYSRGYNVMAIERNPKLVSNINSEINVIVDDIENFNFHCIKSKCTIIGNPPYRLAESHLRLFLKHFGDPIEHIALLLKLDFLGSMRRAKLFNKYTPKIVILNPRPSFTNDNKTDGHNYGWFLWSYGVTGSNNLIWDV